LAASAGTSNVIGLGIPIWKRRDETSSTSWIAKTDASAETWVEKTTAASTTWIEKDMDEAA